MERTKENSRSNYLINKYGHIMKWRNDAILKTGVIEIAVDKVHPSKLDYGESAEFVLMVAINALKISQTYGKEDFIVYCDMREASIKNLIVLNILMFIYLVLIFVYIRMAKYIKYVDAIVMKAMPYRLRTAFFILGKSSNYAILYQAFYKIAQRIIHPETMEKFKILYK